MPICDARTSPSPNISKEPAMQMLISALASSFLYPVNPDKHNDQDRLIACRSRQIPRARPPLHHRPLALAKSLLPRSIFPNNQTTHGIRTKSLPSLHWQLRRKFQSTRPLHRLNRDLKVRNRLLIRYRRIRKHESPNGNRSRRRPILRKNNLVEMRRYSNIRRVTNNLIRHPPLPIHSIPFREV